MNPPSLFVKAAGRLRVKSPFNVSCTILPMFLFLLLSMLPHESIAGGLEHIEQGNIMDEASGERSNGVECNGAVGRENATINFGQFVDAEQANHPPFALIILNQPITAPHFALLRERASLVICADGGFNHLLEYCLKNTLSFSDVAPDIIVGDLDSLSPSHLSVAMEHGIRVVRKADQDSNDFEKSIIQVITESAARSLDNVTIVALGALDGRLDHTLASLSILYQFAQYRIYLVSDSSLATLIPAVSARVPHSMII